MGLLSKALRGSPSTLDDAGIALRDRLLRLSSKSPGSSAYTALSLLKGYGAFKSGACLELKDDGYTSYVSVGMGVSRVIIPPEKIIGKDQSFFEIENPESLSLKFFTPGMKFWIFPLDREESKSNLLLAVEESGAGFSPERITLILEDTKTVFVPVAAAGDFSPEAAPGLLTTEFPAPLATEFPAQPGESAGTLPPETNALEPEESFSALETTLQVAPEDFPAEFNLEIPESPLPSENAADAVPPGETFAEIGTDAFPAASSAEKPTKEGIRSKISAYREANPKFQCILLEMPVKPDMGKEDFAALLRFKIDALGETMLLPSGQALLLLPISLDRELIAHRLSASLNTKVPACFEADNPEKALELIQPYL